MHQLDLSLTLLSRLPSRRRYRRANPAIRRLLGQVRQRLLLRFQWYPDWRSCCVQQPLDLVVSADWRRLGFRWCNYCHRRGCRVWVQYGLIGWFNGFGFGSKCYW